VSRHSGQPSAKRRHSKPLVERIDDHLAAHGPTVFHDLALALYPERASHRYQSNGGPPGCYMALSAAIRRGGFPVGYDERADRIVRPRK